MPRAAAYTSPRCAFLLSRLVVFREIAYPSASTFFFIGYTYTHTRRASNPFGLIPRFVKSLPKIYERIGLYKSMIGHRDSGAAIFSLAARGNCQLAIIYIYIYTRGAPPPARSARQPPYLKMNCIITMCS